MLQAGSIVELMLGSNFTNPGFLNSNPGVIQSFVNSQKGKSASSRTDSQFSADNFIYNDQMLSMLRNWTLTQSILNTFKTTLSDVYLTAEPQVDVGSSEYNKEVNKFIKSIGLMHNIITNLEDDLYYGQRAFYLDFESSAIISILNSREFDQVRFLGKPYRYRFNGSNNGDKFLAEYNKICSIMFNPTLVGSKQSDKSIKSGISEIDALLCDVEYYRGRSILRNVLYLIFQHFLKSLLASLLSIKNTVKPNLLKAEVQPGVNQELNIVEAINNIEALLNNGEYTFDFRTSSPSAILSTIYNSIVNSVKVVPGISNYTNFDLIQQPDETAKIESLTRDVNDLQTQIINLVGIPEELFGGTGNRWEIIQRSSRYNSIIGVLCDSVNLTIRNVAKSYIYHKYEKNLSVDSITVNLGSYNSIFASGISSKLQVLTDSLDKISNLIDSLNKFKSNELCDLPQAAEYIGNYLSAVDSNLAKLVDLNKFKSKPEPQSGEGETGVTDGGQW